MKEMMRKSRLLVSLMAAALAAPWLLNAQNNLELLAHLPYPSSLANDVWHYTAPDGKDYALVGLRSGVSIVSLANPAQPQEVQFIPGAYSTWRDLKVWGQHAYVTADQSGSREGLLVIDLSGLPDTVTWHNWKPLLPGQTDSLFTCHNLWVDEFGYGYLSGCNVNNGGVVFLDVFSQPGSPQFAGFNPPVYAHDCYTLNNRLFTADVYAGEFSIYDVSDKSNPVLLATQQTPYQFCHNVWPSADGNILFTTDEKPNAPTAAYDVSDPGNIRLLDEFRPEASKNTGVIPHNAHVLGDFVIISHYTDGCVIADATRPDNLVEIATYDTSPDFASGFHGAWGADPFLSSGLIAVTDIENGLFILKPTYRRACYLEGNITDARTGLPIAGASISFADTSRGAALSNTTGDYKTGLAQAGNYEVLIFAKGYFEQRLPATLTEGALTLLSVSLTPLPPHRVSGRVSDNISRQGIEAASVLLENEYFTHETTCDEQGFFELDEVLQGDYWLHAGKWGFAQDAQMVSVDGDQDYQVELGPAYQDNFSTDLGWTESGTAQSGQWERGIPLGLFSSNVQWRPQGDSPDDPGRHAWVTGNQGSTIFDDQVDDGETRLTSPPMELYSRYYRPQLAFDYWFFNATSNNAANDSMAVHISNGRGESVPLAVFATNKDNVQQWTAADTFDLISYIQLTDEMRLSVTVSDREQTPNVMEAGIDHFRVWDLLRAEDFTASSRLAKLRAFPNPFGNAVSIDYKIERDLGPAEFILFNSLGQVLLELPLESGIGRLSLAPELVPGLYFGSIRTGGELSQPVRLVRAP
jgi:choice-of-anchor B domain-containing protein